MKQLKYIVLFITFGLLASCLQTDGLFDTTTSGEEVLLDLKCVTMGQQKVVVTKAWEGATDTENYIRDLRVYIFSKSGSLVGYGLFGNAALTEKDYGYWRNLENISTKTGEVYIYAVANVSTSQYPLSETDLKLLTDIDPLNLSESSLTLDTFKDIKFGRIRDGLNPLDERFMMVGSVNDGNLVTISRNAVTNEAEISAPTDNAAKELRLYRILSKNTINISAGTGVTFTLTSYGLYNVPNGGSLVKSNDQTATFNTSYPEEFSRLLTSDQSSLSFYLPENMAGSGQNITTWQDREKNSYDTGAKVFTNAPENSTYLVLRGNYSKPAPSETGRDIQANVEYTIHFGDFGSDLSDFDVERNFSYTYNVTINGVDDIIVEARKEGDMPAEEGIVLEKADANSIIEVDCHYEARTMSFSKEEVANEEGGLMLRFETPFGTSRVLYVRADGVYDGPTGEAKRLSKFTADGKIAATDFSGWLEKGNELDYNWLHFVKNTTTNRMAYNDALTNVAKWPGDNNQLGGSLANGTAHMDVFSFLRQLVADASAATPTVFFTDSDTQNVTCFIDENYYPDRSWAEYVNKEEGRTAYFLTEEFHVSEDNKSIYTVIKYAVKQKSIWTFYNPAMAKTVDAYGVESVSEETVASNGISSGQHNDNGFSAARTYQNNQNFYSNSTQAVARQQYQYTTARKACISRNRDADGSGTINNNEMRWYLATVNQYKGIYTGLDVLPISARMFDINMMKEFPANPFNNFLGEYHYYTASSSGGWLNTYEVYWAEEGVTVSPQQYYTSAFHVRCVRTLQSNGNGETDPDRFYNIDENAPLIVDLTLVNPGALRPYHGGGFPSHYETEDQNKLYSRFEINATRLPNTYSYEVIKGPDANTMLSADDDVCQQELGGNWRVPNARELSLMQIALEEDNTFIEDNHWASTRFNGNRYGGANGTAGYKQFSDYKGFGYWNNQGNYNITIEPTPVGSASGYVRCVRDVQVAEAQSEYNNGGSLTE